MPSSCPRYRRHDVMFHNDIMASCFMSPKIPTSWQQQQQNVSSAFTIRKHPHINFSDLPVVSFLNAKGLSATFCFFTLFSTDFCRAWPYFFDLVTALLDFSRSAGFSDFFHIFSWITGFLKGFSWIFADFLARCTRIFGVIHPSGSTWNAPWGI